MPLWPSRPRRAFLRGALALAAALPLGAAAQGGTGWLPAGVQRLADLAYGADPRQRLDVYLPPPAAAGGGSGAPAPVVLMVHGGAWTQGDKAMPGVVREKVARWVPRGVVFISVNYRLHPAATLLQQAEDVAAALAFAQGRAAGWGADAGRFVLMGHSAGAHLVALVHASPTLAQRADARPWLGAVALDSAALNVPALMSVRHHGLYDGVMGSDPAFWAAVSPQHALAGAVPPLQLVCSTDRPDRPCQQAEGMARRVRELGGRAEVLPQPLGHGQINHLLGREGGYTRAVEAFMASLDPLLGRLLGW